MTKKYPKSFFKYEYAIEMLEMMLDVADNNKIFAEAVSGTSKHGFDPKRWEKLYSQAWDFLQEERTRRFEAALEKEKEI